MPLDEIDLLVIENVGNLVCPAEFRVGEDARAMVCSVTEGEDKPLKYPLMFRACELVIVNKIDLLPHLDVDLDLLLANIDAVQPRRAERMLASARTGEGVDALRDWLVRVAARQRRDGLTARRRPSGAGRRACSSAARGRTSGSSRPRPGASRASATRWPSGSPAGGRLIALGGSPAARSDARHVAVEFVHPVIVGKRALPAIALTDPGGRRRARRSPGPRTW